MTLTPNELLAMVASIKSDKQFAEYEANWEDIDSDDGHLELYLDDLDK